jgi:phospholipase C
MTSAFNFSKPDTSIPALPSTIAALPEIIAQCAANLAGFLPFQLPVPQTMPTQEAGMAIRPNSSC